MQPSYAVLTPARDEEENLRRLAACMTAQTVTPTVWLVVDDGSTDGTAGLVDGLGYQHPWVRRIASAGAALERGAPIVRAFHIGLDYLGDRPDVIFKLDADISFEPDHFERVLAAFAADPMLGIAGGRGYELERGEWRQRHSTGPSVWGANRGYRRECLQDILPLEDHMGWDTLDMMRAKMRGWHVQVVDAAPFKHHRPEGERDGAKIRTYMIQGAGAWYMRYRPSYLLARTAFRMLRDPAAVGLLLGYLRARARRQRQCADLEVTAYLRRQQRWRMLTRRAREARQPRRRLQA